jgi:anaerobic magnesium-protoporphyrin IX monomethyl ester cyclase
MKVMLVLPTMDYLGKEVKILSMSDFPTGFGYLAASLKQSGHEVIGVNPNNKLGYATKFDMLKDVLTESITKHKPDLIGLGGLCTDYHFLRDAMALIRNVVPHTPIVLGGGIVNNDFEYIHNLLKPDYSVVGYGEHAIVRIANGECEKGIITENDIGEIDDIPFPDYEPFNAGEMVDRFSMATRLLYRYSRPYARPFIITTARGCPFSCTFCVHERGIKYRARSIENVMEEIRIMYDKYKFNILIMMDELFAVNKKRMVEMCNAIIAGKEKYGWDFDWVFQTHASANLDLTTLKLAKKAGCYLFSYGIESASPTVLESMNKRAKPEQFVEAIRLSKEAGVGFSGNLIFGDVAETDDTMAESLNFWITHCRDSFVFLSRVVPYPGSKLFKDCETRGMIPDKEKFYDMIDQVTWNMTKIPDEDILSRYNLLNGLERGWHLTSNTFATKVEHESVGMYKFYAVCPHCGKEIMYRYPLNSLDEFSFLGLGCTQCNQKLRINIKRLP